MIAKNRLDAAKGQEPCAPRISNYEYSQNDRSYWSMHEGQAKRDVIILHFCFTASDWQCLSLFRTNPDWYKTIYVH